jgi:hypothetical protein
LERALGAPLWWAKRVVGKVTGIHSHFLSVQALLWRLTSSAQTTSSIAIVIFYAPAKNTLSLLSGLMFDALE